MICTLKGSLFKVWVGVATINESGAGDPCLTRTPETLAYIAQVRPGLGVGGALCAVVGPSSPPLVLPVTLDLEGG